MKIIRISNETHSAFKKLCLRENKKLSEGAEIVIASTLKRGTLKEVKKSVYTQIQSLENTFRAWMKQQEKTHLRGISEDLLILSKRLKDVPTRSETEELLNGGIDKINNTSKDSLAKYESMLHTLAERKKQFWSQLKYYIIGIIGAIALYFFTMLILDFRLNQIYEEHRILKDKQQALRDYCLQIERELNVPILKTFDKKWNKEKHPTNTQP